MRTIIWDDGCTKYILGGGPGSWAESKESNRIPKGTTRYIKGLLMYLYIAEYGWFKNRYCWTPVNKEVKWSDLEDWRNKYE